MAAAANPSIRQYTPSRLHSHTDHQIWPQKKKKTTIKAGEKRSHLNRSICRAIRSQTEQNPSGVALNGDTAGYTLAEEDQQQTRPGGNKMRVAYQGIPGAFSEAAAITVHPGCLGVPCKGYEDAIWAVESRRADRAILPVEGTLEGNVVRNYDLLLHHSLHIVDEIQLFVNYCLLAAPGVKKTDLRRVVSHPMALAHCTRGLSKLGLDVTREALDDTAGAAEFVHAQALGDTAAIASCRAAGIYGLDVLARGVQDEPWNVTRFLVLARTPRSVNAYPLDLGTKSKDDLKLWKTSIVIAHEGGLAVLMKVLAVFSLHGISLTKLEVKGQGGGVLRVLDVNDGGTVREFEFVFYIDFEGSVVDSNAREAIEEVRGFATFVRVLGSYLSDPHIHSLD